MWPPPATPNRLGNWVIAMVRPAPILKPTRMLSLISFDEHAQPQQPGDQAKHSDREGREAGDLGVTLRVASAIAPTVPAIISEIADVGPIASWREDPSNA